MNENSPTERLASFVSNLKYSDVPKTVVDHMKLCLLDTIGCGLFGSTLPWGKILAKFAKDLGGKKESTLLGMKYRASAPNAALANGTMIHGFELDDIHRLSIIHPGSVTLPAALAIGETRKKCTGKEFLTAMVSGYEVGLRVGMCVGASHLHRGYHPTGTHGTFAAAAAAGKLLGLDEEKMVHALGIAGTQAAGLMAAQYAAMVKRMHAGRASQSGVYGALLADRGLTGITDILEADYGGYCKVMGESRDLDQLTRGLGRDYEVLNVGFKAFSCCGSNFTSLEALSRIMKDEGLQAQEIKKITIRSTTVTKLHVGWDYKPEGMTAAQMNLPYCLSVMALEGETFVDQFTEKKIRDPKILEFVKKVEVVPDPELDRLGQEYRHAIVCQVETTGGRSFERRVEFAKGGPNNPISRDEVENKFRKLAGKVLSEEKVRDLYVTIQNLDKVSSLSELSQCLVPS
jgi:2-methylcitrate dehydratase PrpD